MIKVFDHIFQLFVFCERNYWHTFYILLISHFSLPLDQSRYISFGWRSSPGWSMRLRHVKSTNGRTLELSVSTYDVGCYLQNFTENSLSTKEKAYQTGEDFTVWAFLKHQICFFLTVATDWGGTEFSNL